MEGAIADHAAGTVVEVEHRREAEVDAAGAQLGAEDVAGGARRFHGAHRAGAAAAVAVVHPHLAEHAHRRQRREAVAAEALDAATLVVDADEQVGADRLDLGDQLGELQAVAPVASEQDDPAGERMGEAAAIVGVEGEPGDVEDDRGVVVVHWCTLALRAVPPRGTERPLRSGRAGALIARAPVRRRRSSPRSRPRR